MSEEEIIDKINYMINNWHRSVLEIKVEWIQGILDLYNKEKEKNKELKSMKYHIEKFREQNLSNEIDYVIALKSNFMPYLKTDYISKNKIRKKIEELESIEPADDDYNFEMQNDIHSKINILQELLEERK